MRITGKGRGVEQSIWATAQQTCTYQMFRKKGKEIFKHNMSEDGNSKLKFC